jgi:hypothetical protein
MALDTVVGGVALENGLATQTKTTAADGTVTTQVVAGTQPTPVRVRASTASGLTAVSSNLTIQSGLPTQARFSLSVETFNIEGWQVDGTRTKVTIRAADRVGNPVPDNTVINFRSSGAALQPSCRTTGGACTVEFVSQANRPLTAPVGRITVLANASGLESFQDSNGNNRYDMGEPFEDLGDAFVDNNYDRVWQAGEDFIPYNAAATAACATGLAAAPPPMKPMTCDGVWGGAQVRAQAQIILSGSNPVANIPGSIALAPTGPAVSECTGGFNALIADVNGNPMPAGTTITAEATGVTAKVLVDVVPNTLAAGGTVHPVLVTGGNCTGMKAGAVTLKVTTPLKLTTPFVVQVSY